MLRVLILVYTFVRYIWISLLQYEIGRLAEESWASYPILTFSGAPEMEIADQLAPMRSSMPQACACASPSPRSTHEHGGSGKGQDSK